MMVNPSNLWAMLTTGGGVLASFGAAVCCALPLALASAGLGSAWLAGISPVVAPYRIPLLVVASALLLLGAVRLALQFRQASTCPTDSSFGSPVIRYSTLGALLLGVALLAGAFLYG